MSITTLLTEKSSPYYVFAYLPTGVAISAALWSVFASESYFTLSPFGTALVFLMGGFIAAVFASVELFERVFNYSAFHFYFWIKQRRNPHDDNKRYEESYKLAVESSLMKPVRNKIVILLNLIFSMTIFVILGYPLLLNHAVTLSQTVSNDFIGAFLVFGFIGLFLLVESWLIIILFFQLGYKTWLSEWINDQPEKSVLKRQLRKLISTSRGRNDAVLKIEAVGEYRLAVSEGRENHAQNILAKINLGLWFEVIISADFIRQQAIVENESFRQELASSISALIGKRADQAFMTWFNTDGGFIQAWFQFLSNEKREEYQKDRLSLEKSGLLVNAELKIPKEHKDVRELLSFMLKTNYFFSEISRTSMNVRLNNLINTLNKFQSDWREYQAI